MYEMTGFLDQVGINDIHASKTMAIRLAPSYKEFMQNMELKMHDEEFLEDVTSLLRPEIQFEPHTAYSLVCERLIDSMPGRRD